MTSSTFSLNQKREKRGYSPPIGSCFLIRYVNRFFRECRNTQTIVITVTNQNKDNVTKSPRELKAKKLAKTWVTESLRFKFYIWLVEGEGWVSFPFKKITKISKAKRKQSYNIFDTHLKISLSNYSSSLFLKYYFCTGRVAQGYISWRQRGRWYGLNDGVGHCPSSSCPRPFWPMLYLSLASLKYL